MTLATSAVSTLTPALVARDEELSCLRAALGEATAGRGCVVTVYGAAGTGKTRLLDELRAAADGVLWLAAGPDVGRPAEPCALIADLLRAVDAAAPQSGATWDGVRSLMPAAPELRDVAPDVRQRLLAAAVARALHGMAEQLPVVLCCEDVHRADRMSLGILADLADHVADAPILLLATSHPQEAAGPEPAGLRDALAALHSAQGGRQIELAQLTEAETRLVVGSCFDGSGFRNDFLRLLHNRSGGLPHHIVHYLAFLRDQGIIRRRRDLWTNAPVSADQLPEYQASIAIRLAGLSPLQADILNLGATRGGRFEDNLIADALGEPQVQVREALHEIAATTGLLQPDGDGYAFEHAFVWQAVYQRMDESQRRSAHDRLAAVLRHQQPEAHQQLAHHLLRAGHHTEAAPHLLAAAQAAFDACDFWEAQEHLHAALADGAAPNGSHLRAEVLVLLAEVAGRLGDSDRSARICTEVLHDIEMGQWPDLRARTLMHMGRARTRSGDRDEAVQLYAEARAIFAASQDHRMCATVDLRLGNVAFERSQLAEAETLFARARHAAEGAGSLIMTGGACTNLGVVASVRGDHDSALTFYAAAVEAYERAGYRHGLAMTHHNMGMTLATLERWHEALAQYDAGEGLARESGTTDVLANVLVSRAVARAELGDLEEALVSCTGARTYYDQMQDDLGLAECDKVEGMVYRRRGLAAEAERMLRSSQRVFAEHENQLGVGECELELGLLHKDSSEIAKARQHLSAAVAAFSNVGAERERLKAEGLLVNLPESTGP